MPGGRENTAERQQSDGGKDSRRENRPSGRRRGLFDQFLRCELWQQRRQIRELSIVDTWVVDVGIGRHFKKRGSRESSGSGLKMDDKGLLAAVRSR